MRSTFCISLPANVPQRESLFPQFQGKVDRGSHLGSFAERVQRGHTHPHAFSVSYERTVFQIGAAYDTAFVKQLRKKIFSLFAELV
jgi:hypothetical protein